MLTITARNSYRAAQAESGYPVNPYGILIVGYRFLAIASGTTTNGPISSLDIIEQGDNGTTVTLTDGTLAFGNSNRQFAVFCPIGLTLVKQ